MHIIVKSLPHANIDPVNEQGEYRLVDEYTFLLRIDGEAYLFTIEKGFHSNGASVPWWGRWLLERDGVHRESALIHDWFYDMRGHVNAHGKPFSYNRKDADQMFRECLKFQGVASWRVWIFYNAVRIGGSKAWRT